MDLKDWDCGKALLQKLSNNEYFSWDLRYQFSMNSVNKIIDELVQLEPTKLVTASYVSELVDYALRKSNISLSTAVLDESFVEFANDIRSEKTRLDQCSQSFLSDFVNRVQDSIEKYTGEKLSFRDDILNDEQHSSAWERAFFRSEIPLLVRDAMFATKLPKHWIYTTGAAVTDAEVSKRIHSDILQFPSIADLESAVHERSLGYGFRYVCINEYQFNIDAILYTSEGHAFLMADMEWDQHKSRMVAKRKAHQSSVHGLDYVSSHFPSLPRKQMLTLKTNEHQVVGSIKTCDEKSKVWLYMLIELIYLGLNKAVPSTPMATIKALTSAAEQGQEAQHLPVRYTPPFSIKHKSVHEIGVSIGIDKSPIKEQLWSIVDGLTIDDLMPRDGCLYYNAETKKRYKEPEGFVPHPEFTVKLLPYPYAYFGDEVGVSEAVNYVLSQNLPLILNKTLEFEWDSDFEGQKKWIEARLKSKKKHICNRLEQWNEARDIDSSTLTFNQRFADDTDKECRRLSVKFSLAQLWKMPSSVNVPSLLVEKKKSIFGVVTGFNFSEALDSGSKGGVLYFVAPNSSEELMEVFKCEREELPEKLRHWRRWKNHDMIEYPWHHSRHTPLRVAVFKVWY